MTAIPSGGLKGKSFYLHDVKRNQCVTITDIINRLGGKVDSFLTKDVNVVVTGVKEAPVDLPVDNSCTDGRKKSGAPKPLVCGSRGKALLEKAIHNNEKWQSSVLANARSWGVKVYHVDQFLKFINHWNQKMKMAKKKTSKQTAPHVKAGVLRSPYLKVEDSSRKFRPYYAQALNFPMMSYSGKFSPFELIIPRQSVRIKDEDASKDNCRKKEEHTSSCHKLHAPPTASATPKGPTKKSSGYCECCHMPFKDQYEHLESEVHRSFVRNDSNYAVVDEITAGMQANFVCNPNQDVDSTLMKSSEGISPHLSEFTVSEYEESLQTPLFLDCGHSPPVPDMLTPSLDNREQYPELTQSPSGQQNVTIHPYAVQNNPDPHDHDKLGLYISCTTKVQDIHSSLFCIDIAPHQVSSKSQSTEKKPRSLLSSTPSETQPYILNPNSSQDKNGESVHKNQDQCEGGNGQLILHKPKGRRGTVPDMEQHSSHNQKQDWHQGLKMCLKSPKVLLQEGEEGRSKSCRQFVMDHRMLPSTKRSLKSVQDIVGTPEFGLSYISFPHFLPFPHLNLKKRRRSTPSLQLAKRRKISQSEKSNPSWDCSTPWIRQYSSVLSTMPFLPVSKVGFTAKKKNRTADAILETNESSLNKSSFANQIPTQPSLKYFTPPSTHCFPYQVDQEDNTVSQPCVEQSHKSFPIKDPVESQVTAYSSDLEPPQLVPFFHEDHQLQRHQDPPELFPFFFQTPEDASHTSASKVSNSSFLSHSGTSVCIESALVPNLTWSTASSESDWDSGLLSWLATAVPLPTKGRHDDLGPLLQKPHTGMQDGSYTTQLCSILQPY